MDIEIFPHRILGSDTTERLLNEIEGLEDVNRTILQGPRLAPESPDDDPRYAERRIITVQGKEIELKVKAGRIFVDLSEESTIDQIREICNEILTFGFDINIGTYIRTQKTVTDSIKYGNAELPDELIGMNDQYSMLEDRVTYIQKDGNDS
ncbi:methyl-coenzyme M reductase operon protein D [Methanobrevibacter filiformis]|uniref:Methyl-coenzyme M reductase operon protein D n=1 Tax=Methanobrevibacter filiformis TaxID=55758 RepID=A0A166A6P3_9EURY|nr:methyl-coenzyme M reductase operon protein D [Methanobrevibacter filiformis]KZX11641.1 methyl-coenzyme M reductase operon protein D [Methanobrevibacter filiformis]